jgi:hypothetical protein
VRIAVAPFNQIEFPLGFGFEVRHFQVCAFVDQACMPLRRRDPGWCVARRSFVALPGATQEKSHPMVSARAGAIVAIRFWAGRAVGRAA